MSGPGDYGPPVLRVEKGDNYTVGVTVPLPRGEVTVELPVPEIRRLVETLSQMADEQEAQMDADLSRMSQGG